jgi:hypothetical protein
MTVPSNANNAKSSLRSTVRSSSNRRGGDRAVAVARPGPLPIQFVCIDPDEATNLFAYLNGTDESADKPAARAHLGLCLFCQEKLAPQTKIDRALLDELSTEN